MAVKVIVPASFVDSTIARALPLKALCVGSLYPSARVLVAVVRAGEDAGTGHVEGEHVVGVGNQDAVLVHHVDRDVREGLAVGRDGRLVRRQLEA